MEQRYRFLEHTADVGIEIRAPTLAAVYEIAGEALFQLIAPRASEEAPVRTADWIAKDVESEGDEPELLLVNFLNDLLYLFEVEGLLFRRFEVRSLKSGRLQATAAGEPLDPGAAVDTVVKAVTHHEACVERSGSHWRGVVYLDL